MKIKYEQDFGSKIKCLVLNKAKNYDFLSKREIGKGDSGQGIMKTLNSVLLLIKWIYNILNIFVALWKFVMLLKLTVENLNLFLIPNKNYELCSKANQLINYAIGCSSTNTSDL